MRSYVKQPDRAIRTMSSEDDQTGATSMTDAGHTDQNHSFEARPLQTMSSRTIDTTTTSMQQATRPHPPAKPTPGDFENSYSQSRSHMALNRSRAVGPVYDSQTSLADDSSQMGRHENQGVAHTDDQAAAEALLNLRSRSAVSWSCGDANKRGAGNSNPAVTRRQGYQHVENMVYGDNNVAACGENEAAWIQNTAPSSHAYTYSDTIAKMQNTIAGLGIGMESIQAQQAYMHTQQETMSSAMQQVMAMLQLLIKEKQGFDHSNYNSQIQNQSSNFVSHGDSQGENRTVSTRVNYGQTDQGTMAYRTVTRAEALSTNNDDTQSRYRSQYSNQDDASHLQPSYHYNQTNMQQIQGTLYRSECPERPINRSLVQKSQTYRFSDEATRSPTTGQNISYSTDYATNRADAAGNNPDCRWVDRGQRYTEGSRQAQCQSSPARNSGRERFRDNRGHSTREPYDAKIPPFNGKEDWKVWVNRFEAVAERRNWDGETRLDHLLPKLQGKAGDFVYTQLPRRTLASYNDLIKELNCRFRVVETKKTYAARFSQRTQKPGETAEEFAAELKRLYAKAYEFRDENTRQEDLVRRFLDGLRDSDARFEIEYNKEPDDIDEAVYHAVNFIQTKRRSSDDSYQDRKAKKYARRASYEDDNQVEGIESETEDEELHHINRVPTTGEQKRKPKDNRPKKEDTGQSEASQSESLRIIEATKDMMQTFMDKMKEIAQPANHPTGGQQYSNYQGRKPVTCYGCQQQGHIIRDCPNKNNTNVESPEIQDSRGNQVSLKQPYESKASQHHLN